MKVLCNITKDKETMYYMEELSLLILFKDVGEVKRKCTRLFAGDDAQFLFENLSTKTTKKTNVEFSQHFYEVVYSKLDTITIDIMEVMAKVEDRINQKLSATNPVVQAE